MPVVVMGEFGEETILSGQKLRDFDKQFNGNANQPTYLEGGSKSDEQWPEPKDKPKPTSGLCAPSIFLDAE